MINHLSELKVTSPLMLDDTLSLQIINKDNISPAYIRWMNDPEVVKYTEQRFVRTSETDIKSYLQKIEDSPADILFGIYQKSSHIGTVKLGAINIWHKTAALSYLIGEKDQWGKGIASRAISEMTEIGFSVLGLDKIIAGVYANNAASARVLEKNNFELEGIRKSQFIFENDRIDALLYGRRKLNG